MTGFHIARVARASLAAALSISIASCSAYREADSVIDTQHTEAKQAARVIHDVQPLPEPTNVEVNTDVWLGDKGVKFSNGQPLPVKLEESKGITLNTGPKTLVQIANLIQTTTSIPVRNAETVMLWDYDSGSNGGAGASNTVSGGTPGSDSSMPTPPSSPGRLGEAFGASGAASAGASGQNESPLLTGTPEFPPLALHYSGSLSGLLDQVSDHFGISWKFEDGAIKFVGLETRTYTLWALNIIQNTTSSVKGQVTGESGTGAGGTGSSGGASANSTSGTEAQISSNYWTNVLSTIRSIVPQSTQFITTNPSAGTITVTARPSVQERVAEYVRNENDRLARQVAITTKVYAFQATDSDNYNVDLQAAFNGSSRLGFGVTNAINATAQDASQFQVGILSGGFAGSQAFVNALSEAGKISLVTSASVTTLNNQTAPISVLNQKGYLARVSVTTDSNAGTTTASLEPGVVSSGFTMNVTPRIMSNDEMILNYSTTLSDLVSMTEFSSNGSAIQIPEVNSRAIMESVRIKSGSTLVLAGFEQTENTTDNSGVGLAKLPILGGGVSGKSARKLIVILMTPVVLDEANQAVAPTH